MHILRRIAVFVLSFAGFSELSFFFSNKHPILAYIAGFAGLAISGLFFLFAGWSGLVGRVVRFSIIVISRYDLLLIGRNCD